jgi:hypothetical protein
VGEVRSSIASRLGLPTAGLPAPSREVEGIAELMLDATTHYGAELTAERLGAGTRRSFRRAGAA